MIKSDYFLKLNNITKSYNDKKVLDNFSYDFSNKTYCIMGDSGSGKTTLLNIIMGLESSDSGQVVFNKEDINIACVFQEDRLCENINALKNVLIVFDKETSEQKEKAKKLLEILGIIDIDNKPVSQFSGGMKRRVAIARALVKSVDLYIFDEPLKGLDEDLKNKVLQIIKDYTLQKTMLFVTHDKQDAVKLQAQILKI